MVYLVHALLLAGLEVPYTGFDCKVTILISLISLVTNTRDPSRAFGLDPCSVLEGHVATMPFSWFLQGLL